MKFRELFFNKIFTLRNLFFLGNFLLLFLFLAVLAQDSFREWKPFQKAYKRLEAERIRGLMARTGNADALEAELKMVRSQPVMVRQILAVDLKRVDRCTTCHLGYDTIVNPSLVNDHKAHPYAAPANAVHAAHPFDKYGCAVCHEGQGLATTFVDAGHMPRSPAQRAAWEAGYRWKTVEFWQDPMLAGSLVYASCSKCHEDLPDVPGIGIVRDGKELAFRTGCVGCHQIRGEGGPLAPDLALETSVKPVARIDFGYAVSRGLISRDDRSLENWIRLHFATHPAVLTPGDPEGKLSPDPRQPQPVAPSAMPYFGFNKEQAESLVAYVLSLKREESIPHSYRAAPAGKPEPRFAGAEAHGRYVYLKYGCAGCHGENADRGIPIYNKLGGRAPDLVKVAGTYTPEELARKIQEGVNPEAKEDESGPTPPIYMPAFKERIKGKELADLVTYLFSVGEKLEDW